MNINEFSPYIRVATPALLISPCIIYPRVLLDYEIIFIEEGKCIITYEDKEFIAQKNDVVFIRPNISHKIELFPGINLSQPHIHFDVDFDMYSSEVYVCFKNRKSLNERDLKMMRKDIFVNFQQPSPIIHISNLEEFLKIFYSIIETFRYKPPLHEIHLKSKMIDLLTMIIKDNFPELSSERGKFVFNIHMVKNYIDFNYKNNLSLDTLSSQFNYNKYYILKKFKDQYGVSPIQYYNNLRLMEAKRLLKTHSVNETAELLRYSSIYVFSRAFKNKFGIYPTQYKNDD